VALENTQDVAVKIPMPPSLRDKWEKFTYDRGYGKGPFLRSFIEAVTDPAKGPRIERIMREQPEAAGPGGAA
jgi:hypothetical protein